MKHRKASPFLTTLGLAAVAGARSMMAPALLSHTLKNNRSRRLKRSRLSWMQSPTTATILKVLTVGELIGDKAPGAPERTTSSALTGRALSGMLVGATLYTRQRRSAWVGAGWGLLGAVASSYATLYLRQQLGEITPLPDPIWGTVEDIAAFAGGRQLLR